MAFVGRRRIAQTMAALMGALVLALAANAGGAAASGGGGQPSEPTFAQQTAGWTPAQIAAYSAKLQAVHDFAKARASGITPDICLPTCVPPSHYSRMTIVWEGSADCACGPATAVETFTTFNYYYGKPNPVPSLNATITEMQNKGWYNCATGGTWRTGLMYELNLHQTANVYVLGAIYSGTDVYNDTAIDIGLANFPVTYDGETYGKYGYPLDNYQGVDWGHYFPAYGYDQYGWVYVADPHYAYNHKYTGTAVYEFIANFPKLSPQVVW